MSRRDEETFVDKSKAFDTLAKDLLGGDESGSDDEIDYGKRGKERRRSDEDEGEKKPDYMFFDFRKGAENFPQNCEIVDPAKAEVLLEKQTVAVEESLKVKKSDKDNQEEGTTTKSGGGTSAWASSTFSQEESTEIDNSAQLSDATFEVLQDGSTAFVMKPGYRLRLQLKELLQGGDAAKEERVKKAARDKKKKGKGKFGGGKMAGMGSDDFDEDGWASSKWFKEYINEYTITMDIKLLEDPPRDGIALFQTALIHAKDDKRSGKTTLSRSEGECLLNKAGGVGNLGTFGDTTKAKVDTGCWKRIVIAVKCIDPKEKDKKGEMKTWVGTEPGIVLKEDTFVANERFAVDPDSFFLFSSAQTGMMPGKIAIRTVRIERAFASDKDVMEARARDKVSNVFMEERAREVEEQRKGLSLAELFAKPRPMWFAQAFYGYFGDAFIENTALENSDNLAWSFTVINFAMQRMLKQPLIAGNESGFDRFSRGSVSDVLYALNKSAPVFKQMMKMLSKPNESQLLSFLRKLKKFLQEVNTGESLLLPVTVEAKEMLIIVERTTEKVFRFVVVQTDPFAGLKHHAVSPTESMPEIKYRTCMVLSDIPKKNALDDVFWMAVYNMSIHAYKGDTAKFYDVLLPFLTGKPLESSLVEAEHAAAAVAPTQRSFEHALTRADELNEQGLKEEAKEAFVAAEDALTHHRKALASYGAWRTPQRSKTAYVRCIVEAFHYMLMRRGITEIQSSQVQLALFTEMVCMMKNDLHYTIPDDNGVRICNLAVRELCHEAVKFADLVESKGSEENKASESDELTTVNPHVVLSEVHALVDSVTASLKYCQGKDVDLPPSLELDGAQSDSPDDPALTQFRDLLAWDISVGEPDPGQAVTLRKYIPVDFLQIPRKAESRKDAVMAIRMCDRLCTLIENQSHCIKNYKFLILSIIEHVFTQVVPVPKPRAVELSEEDLKRSTRGARRAETKKEEAKTRAAEKQKKIEEVKEAKRTKAGGGAAAASEEKKEAEAPEDAESTEKSKKLKFFGEEEEPDFEAGKAFSDKATAEPCIWEEPITYELQVEILLSLQRLVEHFAAATMSIQQSRCFDGVCVVVSGCMAAVSDVVMRMLAVDAPSEACSQLCGKTVLGKQLGSPGFGISTGTFATQCETIELHTAELSVARTAVLDYFQSPAQQRLEKIFTWEEEYELKPNRALIKYLRNVSREIGYSAPRPYQNLMDNNPMESLLMKNYPELRCYRDIVFYWKFFLNCDRKAFVNYVDPKSPRDLEDFNRMSTQLNWRFDQGHFLVYAFSRELRCCINPKQKDPATDRFIPLELLPTHRFPSTATPSFYVPTPPVKTEDDVIYRPNLPTFEDKYGQVLNQRDSELLISYLTVPYMRLPLILTFFASEDRIHKLQSKDLRLILDSVLFEPGKYLSMDRTGVEPMMVPTPHPELLATPFGLLFNELCRSPDTIIRSVLTLLRGALACDTGSVVDEGATDFNTSTQIILYLARVGGRVDNYLSFIIDHATGKHDCISHALREADVSDEILAVLQAGRATVRELLDHQFVPLLEDYLTRLDKEITNDPTNESLIDRNSRLACDLHAHKYIIYRNYLQVDLTPTVATTIISSFVYLTTRHTWNKTTGEGERLSVPEIEMYEMMTVMRRRIISWTAASKQGVVDQVMQTALQVSSSMTGSFKTSAEVLDNQNRWSRVSGDRSVGRWAVGSTRTAMSSSDSSSNLDELVSAADDSGDAVGEVSDSGNLGVEMDVQVGQMTLRSKHLSALPSDVANREDVQEIFGDATMQASLIERSENRSCYRLVGLNHELEFWPNPHIVCPPLDDEWEREYDPADIFDSEKWITSIFEPVRDAFFVQKTPFEPPTMQFMLHDKPLPVDAEVAVIMGLHQKLGGPFKIVYVYRRLRCVQVFECISHGRQWWFTHHLTTDTRYSFNEIDTSTQARRVQYPEWWLRGAGDPYPGGIEDYLCNDVHGRGSSKVMSVVITRDAQHHLNLSGGKETFVPRRLLAGMVPDALLDTYRFWQDESEAPADATADTFVSASRGYKRMRGYPKKEDDGEFIILLEIKSTGTWVDYLPVKPNTNNGSVIQITGFPGRTVTITRRPKVLVEEDFKLRQRIAGTLETLGLMVPAQAKKKAAKEKDEKDKESFKIDTPVECDYEGKGSYWPCVVRRANDDGTYDVEFEGDYKWLGIKRGVASEILQKRGKAQEMEDGEELWHWEGISDDEDYEWRDESDDEGDKDDEEAAKSKRRLTFIQFDQLTKVVEAAKFNEDLCLEALNHLKRVPGVLPFTQVDKLARSVGELPLVSEATPERTVKQLDADDMFLLNLLYAPRRSRLHSMMKVLVRIEIVGQILAWTKASNTQAIGPRGSGVSAAREVKAAVRPTGLQFACPPIDLVELPRLKLAFNARLDHEGVMRLYSVDHVDLYITNERNDMTKKMLAGIPHSLLLSNVRGETQVLVPVIAPVRPVIMSEPFSTFIVLHHGDVLALAERFFLYPVHVSLSFLLTKGLNSAVYLMLLRFLHRDYADVFRLTDSIATDTKFNDEGLMVFRAFGWANEDQHPDSHACRMKISLVIIDSGVELPWDLTLECARNTVKLDSISSSCRMAPHEELQLLESDSVATSPDSKAYDRNKHDEYSMALCYNRQQYLRAFKQHAGEESSDLATIEAACRAPPRALSTNWPYYQDNTVFGENYAQMQEITSADEGEHAWNQEMRGGDETDAPPGGWLVVACFHTLWSAASVKVMPSINEVITMFHDSVNFLSIRADGQGMAAISKELKITCFPTIILLRGGKELKRVEGAERLVEQLINELRTALTTEDKVSHAKQRHRIRLERALALGLPDVEEEVEEAGEVEWTWDPENASSMMNVRNDGMDVVLKEDDELEDKPVWERSTNGSTWKPFKPADTNTLEKAYRSGELYQNRYVCTSTGNLYINDVKITSYMITGFYGYFPDNHEEVRRVGDRLPVPNEESFLDQDQIEMDKRYKEWQDKLDAQKKKHREELVGQDVESIRGSIGLQLNTGVHQWTLRWNHRPARGGNSDAVGICGENFETFGPRAAPIYGGGGVDVGLSLALYSNGEVWHNNKMLRKIAPLPPPPPAAAAPVAPAEASADLAAAATSGEEPGGAAAAAEAAVTPSEEAKEASEPAADAEAASPTPTAVAPAASAEAAPAAAAAAAAPAGGSEPASAEPSEESKGGEPAAEAPETAAAETPAGETPAEEATAPDTPAETLLFGQGTLIKIVLETTEKGGIITFSVNDQVVETIEDVYALLQSTEIYPCLSMCPLDPIAVVEAAEKRAAQKEEDKQKKIASGEWDESMEDEDDEDDDFYTCPSVSLNPDLTPEPTPAEAGTPAEEGDLAAVEAAAVAAAEGAATEGAPAADAGEVTDGAASPAEEPAAGGGEAAAVATSEAKAADAPATESKASDASEAKEATASDPPPVDGAAVEAAAAAPAGDAATATSSDESVTEGAEKPAGATDEQPSPAEAEGVAEEKQAEPVEEAGEAGDTVLEVPIEKIRWMYEIDQQGWRVYSVEASRELEEAARDGKSEYTLTIGDKPHKCNIDEKKVRILEESGDGAETRLRRHIVADGVAGMWEILTMKYEKPYGLTGSALVGVLEKVRTTDETISGHQAGLGFLFLYSLLAGHTKAKVIGGSTGGKMQGFGGGGGGGYDVLPFSAMSGDFKFGKSGSSSSNDSHRFGLLLTQLILDKQVKSLPGSVLNVLGRNKQVALRMPKFKDTRKSQSAFFTGWIDETEPRSPLAELFSKLVPIMTTMKRKGTFRFPPSPPFPELPPAPSKCEIAASQLVELARPELSDYACEKRFLAPIDSATVAQLAEKVHHRLSGDALKAAPPLHIEDSEHFDKVLRANDDKLIVIDFSAKWCGPCKQLEPVFRMLSLRNPVALFLTVDIDECEDLAQRFEIDAVPIIKFIRAKRAVPRKKLNKADTLAAYQEEIRSNRGSGKLLVFDFYAQYCEKACEPVRQTLEASEDENPGALRIVRVDIDVNEDAVDEAKVRSVPAVTVWFDGVPLDSLVGKDSLAQLSEVLTEHLKKVTQKATARAVAAGPAPIVSSLGTIKGAGLEFLQQFDVTLEKCLNAAEADLLTKVRSNAPGDDLESILRNMATSPEQATILATMPLQDCTHFVTQLTRSELGLEPINPQLAFDVSKHDAAQTDPAMNVLKRFKDDVAAYGNMANTVALTKIVKLSDKDIRAYFDCDAAAEAVLTEALAGVRLLMVKLQQLKDSDIRMVQDTIPLLEKASNWINPDAVDDELTKSAKTRFMLNRLAGQNASVWTEFLFGTQISSKGEDDLLNLNPFLTADMIKSIFGLITTSMLRANRLGHTNRCIGTVISLESMLAKVLKIPREQRAEQGPTVIPKLIQVGEDLSKNITTARHYMDAEEEVTYSFDPRYLVFEFVWNIQLRKKQVEIVNDFRHCLATGNSKVKQMIMGAGKTSVVAPLLALIVADGKSLVLSVVPKALVEMSRKNMRETFAAIMVKRIYTLEFDRSTVVKPSMRRGLENAAANRGVVVATPTTLKSVMLAYIEVLQRLKDSRTTGDKISQTDLKMQAEELSKILALFKDGIMLLDEVDLILHPLKSELNFPIGEKFDLDGAEEGERWSLPVHLMDAIFFTSTGKVSSFEQRGSALEILTRLTTVIQQGIVDRHLQRLPHVTLLNTEYYTAAIKPLMAEWSYLWLQTQHLHGIDREEAVQYILEGASAHSETSTKITLIDLALKKIEVELGRKSPRTPPTPGFWKSMSQKEREQKTLAFDELQRSAKERVSANPRLREMLLSQQHYLLEASDIAEEHRKLVNDVYEADARIDERSRDDGRKLGDIEGSIISLHKKITELECARDDSMDNTIIVWCSEAFAPGGSNASAVTSTSVPAVCISLEELGLTVRRCYDAEEAISRARDLQQEGQLRCVIIGGDERKGTCGPGCEDYHSGNCVKCGYSRDYHNGHMCYQLEGRPRGAWVIDPTAGTYNINSTTILTTLTDTDSVYSRKKDPLPPSRSAVYVAHKTMKEEERLSLWQLGAFVSDDPKALVKWISSIPPWKEPSEEEDEEAEAAEDPAAAKALTKAGSLGDADKTLASLRIELEALESARALATADDDAARMQLQKVAEEKQKLLQNSVTSRLEQLTLAEQEFEKLIAATKAEADPEDLRKLYVGPHSGRDAALALAWLEVNRASLESEAADEATKQQLCKSHINIKNELTFLRRMALAAKVVACVSSPLQKKLLNLCHNWLSTFLPHCLAKVNRVSFGLLSVEDCKAAIAENPFVPRSRLKLAVPFVGKDVPSKASEFAHPDVIIGLTVLAYRYSGLRKDDFIDVIDSLTSQFVREIGPARDRESSLRHEKWVFAAGGAIRGLKTNKEGHPWAPSAYVEGEDGSDKEVVQLKFLSKSNQEQMDKLFSLIKAEPLVIHDYLQKSIFPKYMRSQRKKISASGQSIGGDMLVGKRVGFSGTPSDLLPQELGSCQYEVGDDGMMLTTLLDRKVASHEFLQDQWTVELILERIATAENPRFNALIDTGALITGYSNEEVAKQLLDRGLSWCDGVVFLDGDDKQQVLVRATGRVVSADQCGVSLEKRFAFYDQIHTTGMDIKHVVNATAVITLGKDMVFRDYAQGAYRMRGIGAGQKIHLFIIPEVKEIMQRELRDAVIPDTIHGEHVLEDVVAWLIVNSLNTEQTQWAMLCIQNMSNLYRKNAFKCLHDNTAYFVDGTRKAPLVDPSTTTAAAATSASEPPALTLADPSAPADEAAVLLTLESDPNHERFYSCLDEDAALLLFDEPIDFSLEAGVPDPVPFEQKLRAMAEDNDPFLRNDQHAIADEIMHEVSQFARIESTANALEQQQEREQEQEQEKEVEARKDKQVEVEKFVDREYSRQEEVQRPWPFSLLSKPLIPSVDHPFYPLKDFKLRHQEPLEFAPSLMVSSNYFNPNWSGLRRVKNVIMVMEYAPSADPTELRLKTVEEAQLTLTPEQEKALRKAHLLLGFHAAAAGHEGSLAREDLALAVEAVMDHKPSEEVLSTILARFSASKETLSLEEFRSLMTSGMLHPEHKGRYWVALSLAEAETIRRILHVRKKKNPEQIIPDKKTELALHYSPMSSPGAQPAGDGGVIFDASWGWQRGGTHATPYEAAVAHSSFRFFDGDMHHSFAGLNILIRVLRGSIRDRETFFLATTGARRRLERKWQDTPLARVFFIADEWIALKQRAQAIYVVEALKARKLTLWEAFTAIDYDSNGSLSPSEFYGALVWLQVPQLTVEDVADFIDSVDTNRNGMVDYKEYMDLLEPHHEEGDETSSEDTVSSAEEEGGAATEVKQSAASGLRIEPYGAEEIREEMVRRKQAELARVREERIRRQAYKEQLDVKVFEEELEASKSRKGGANPAVFETAPEGDLPETRITDYKFDTNQQPLRFTATGKSDFVPIFAGTAAEGPVQSHPGCPRNHKEMSDFQTPYWVCCECSVSGVNYMCWQCYNTGPAWTICKKCVDSYKRAQERDRRDPAKHPTFLRCMPSCSFSVQIPRAGGADPDTGKFIVSLELRFERLPPKGSLQSLLRFATTEGTVNVSKLQRASVYLNSAGIVAGRPIVADATEAKATTAAAAAAEAAKTETAAGGASSESSKDEAKAAEPKDAADTAADEATAPADATTSEAASKPAEVPRIRPGTWYIVSVAVDPAKGTVATFINGKPCHESEGLDPADLRLQHKLVVLGGGKNIQAKGGEIRRLVIHGVAFTDAVEVPAAPAPAADTEAPVTAVATDDAAAPDKKSDADPAATPAEAPSATAAAAAATTAAPAQAPSERNTLVRSLYWKVANDSPVIGGRAAKIQPVYRGFYRRHVEKLEREKNLAEQEAAREAKAAAAAAAAAAEAEAATAATAAAAEAGTEAAAEPAAEASTSAAASTGEAAAGKPESEKAETTAGGTGTSASLANDVASAEAAAPAATDAAAAPAAAAADAAAAPAAPTTVGEPPK